MRQALRSLVQQLLEFSSRKRWEVLADLITTHALTSFVEVGVWEGHTSIYITDHCSSLQKQWAIDPYDVSLYSAATQFKQQTTGLNQSLADATYAATAQKITIIRESSRDAVHHFADGSLDIVFIDANHEYASVKEDIKLWLPKIRKGGFLCGHDYSLQFFGVVQAVNELLGPDNIRLEEDAVWIYQKPQLF